MAAIEVNGLTRYYGETRGVEELTFTVKEGEVFGILGPDGAGKTTTVRTLMGLQSPTGGGATVLGHDITSGRSRVKMKREAGYIPSNPSFEADMTGQQVLAYHASLKGDERSEELIELFDVSTDRTVREYSRCDTQKLAIVLAFMHDPDIAVLDEPTAGLDTLLQERFYEFIHTQGMTVFFTSPSRSEACNLGDRVGILRNGHLVGVEDSETLRGQDCKSIHLRVAETVDAGDFAFDGVHDIEIAGGHSSRGCSQSVQANGDERRSQMDEKNSDSETGTAHHRTSVQFTYTGDHDTLFEHLLDHTVVDIDITEAPLEAMFTRFYGARLGATGDGSHPGAIGTAGDLSDMNGMNMDSGVESERSDMTGTDDGDNDV